ncbi:hypothetical protein CROQUDRAFT_699455, partial [Cronartium quercuum f. sp. fusiforme G11]
MHKVAGYVSHSANFYCSWCWACLDNIEDMKIEKLRTKLEVIEASEASKAATTLSLKDDIFRETGIWWSKINQLLYCDPVLNLPIGIMHNWFEGVLHQHF